MANIIDELSPDEALTILKQLAKSNKTLQKRIEEIAEKSIRSIDIEGTSMEVYAALDLLDIEDVWDQSGAKSYGYVSPEDKFIYPPMFSLFLERIQPFFCKTLLFNHQRFHLTIVPGPFPPVRLSYSSCSEIGKTYQLSYHSPGIFLKFFLFTSSQSSFLFNLKLMYFSLEPRTSISSKPFKLISSVV